MTVNLSSSNKQIDTILVIDFGSQYTQLIARRVRESNVYSEILPWDIDEGKIKLINPKGIILSGGPLNVYQINKYSFDKRIIQKGIPVLGICFGHQIISKLNGGKVKQSKHREFGLANITKKNNSLLIKNLFKKKNQIKVWIVSFFHNSYHV